jgi:Radical SAM superfamily
MNTKHESFFCPAGVHFAAANGDVFPCTNFMQSSGTQSLGNLYHGFSLNDRVLDCRENFCICPQHKFDPKLYRKALKPRSWTGWRLPYDLWVHWYVTEECFLSCVYCETGNRPFVKQNIRPIDVPALMRTLEGLKRKAVRLSFTGGGEPFAVPNITEACAEITKRHYISFNSNLLGIDVKEFIRVINPRKLLYIQGSLHLKELERTRNIERFAQNVHACRRAGVQVYVTAVGIPSIIPEIPKFKAIFEAKGIFFTFAPFSGIYEGRHYPDAYTETELLALGMTQETAHIHRTERPEIP